ncbi:MAG TPA: hypothetical protein ACFYD0_05540, partial [Candidatus Wunengus sp. YC65]
DLKYATNASGTWVTTTVDSDGGSSTSIALDTSGNAHISYFDYTNGDLKYATNASGTWVTTTVDSDGGSSTSIALDTSGNAHISYCYWLFPSPSVFYDSDLKYATNASGAWVTTTVASGTNMQSTSIALDTSGKVHISYYSDLFISLTYATNASGAWVTTTVDSTSIMGGNTSMALDAAGNAHISYYGYANGLRYATNASGAWVTTTVDSTVRIGEGSDVSIALDTSGNAHISYYDYTNGDLGYASASQTPTTTPTISPTPTPPPSPVVTPTPAPSPSGCDGKVKTVETDTGDFELLKLASQVVTVTVTDAGGCPVANKNVFAKVNVTRKKCIKISSSSETTDENGAAAFKITAKRKAGNAKVTFKAGNIKKKITVTVVSE